MKFLHAFECAINTEIKRVSCVYRMDHKICLWICMDSLIYTGCFNEWKYSELEIKKLLLFNFISIFEI